jgi:hypothetical protein
MKKIVLKFFVLLAIVFIVNTSMAQGKFAPLPGGTYSYTLDIVIANQSDATLTATGLTTGTATISNVTPNLTDIAATVTEIAFDVTYSNDATGTCRIEFIITDEVSACSNTIYVDVPMNPVPTYTLSILADITGYDECQARSGAADNSADALGTDIPAEVNTFTYSVTPVVNNVSGNFDYSYTIDLPDNAVLNSFDNGSDDVAAYSAGVVSYTNVSSVSTDVFTVTFNTTTGVDSQTLTAALTVGASSVLQPADGGGTYEATLTSGGSLSETVNVNAVPHIGSFQ